MYKGKLSFRNAVQRKTLENLDIFTQVRVLKSLIPRALIDKSSEGGEDL